MVSRVFFSDPYETDPHPGADTANRDALEAALLGLQQGAAISYGRGRSIVFTPPLTQGDICTAPALIKVPLRQTRLGLRRRQIMLRYKIYKNATDRHQIDRDILRLTCTP